MILGGDPGTANFGISVIRISKSLLRTSPASFEILRYGLLHKTVRTIKEDLSRQTRSYLYCMRAIRDKYGANAMIMERFQSRRMGGTTIESINLMLGLSLASFEDCPAKLLTASQWKNAAARAEFWFDELYASLKPITPHSIDAICIAIYGLGLLSGHKNIFETLTLKSLERKIRNALHKDIGQRVKKPTVSRRRSKAARR